MSDFGFKFDVIYDEKKNAVNIIRVLFKDECIAFIREDALEDDCSLVDAANDYIKTYGYMAEYRRLWNNGQQVNWSEDLRVNT